MNDQAAVTGVFPDPIEDFEPVHAGHVQVQEENIRKWVSDTVIERAFAVQIGQSLYPVACGIQKTIDPSFLDRLLEEEDIVRVILRDQNIQTGTQPDRYIPPAMNRQ